MLVPTKHLKSVYYVIFFKYIKWDAELQNAKSKVIMMPLIMSLWPAFSKFYFALKKRGNWYILECTWNRSFFLWIDYLLVTCLNIQTSLVWKLPIIADSSVFIGNSPRHQHQPNIFHTRIYSVCLDKFRIVNPVKFICKIICEIVTLKTSLWLSLESAQ